MSSLHQVGRGQGGLPTTKRPAWDELEPCKPVAIAGTAEGPVTGVEEQVSEDPDASDPLTSPDVWHVIFCKIQIYRSNVLDQSDIRSMEFSHTLGDIYDMFPKHRELIYAWNIETGL